MTSGPRHDGLKLLLQVTFAALLAWFWLWLPLGSCGDERFWSSPRFAVFVLLSSVSLGSSVVVRQTGQKSLQRLHAGKSASRMRVGLYVAGVLAFGLLEGVDAAGRGDFPQTICYLDARIYVLECVGWVIMVPCLQGMIKLGDLVKSTQATLSLPRLLEYKDLLRRQLTALGWLVLFATSAAGVLRTAVIARYPIEGPDIFPAEQLLVYGLALTALLAIPHAVAHSALKEAMEEFINEIAPIPYGRKSSESWGTILLARKVLQDAMGKNESAREALTSSVLILSPLLASTFSLLIPTK